MVNKYRAEVDASEFGPGWTIRLDMDGQAKLESQFGEFDFVGKVQLGLAVMSSKYIQAYLKAALRAEDGDPVYVDTGVTRHFAPVVPDVPLSDIAKKCLDSFTLFRYGKDSETWAAENEAKAKEKASTANPTKGTKA